MTGRDYALFLGLSALWGSSYLFIKVAVDGGLDPAALVLLRLALAAAALLLVARLQGLGIPRDARLWRSFAVMGSVGTALPFLLISWGETVISSSLAAILNATVPIVTVLLAHFWTRQERLTPARVAGVLAGFAGVVALVGDAVAPGRSGGVTELWGVLALLASSVCYGVASTFARTAFRGVSPVVASAGQMGAATLCMAVPGAIAIGGSIAERHAPAPGALLAVAALSLGGTAGAYLLYHRLLARVGPTRTAMTTYLLPAFAVAYGALLLHETVGPRLLAGLALILLGVAAVGGRLHRRRAPSEATAAAR